jgi:hypothetical protein
VTGSEGVRTPKRARLYVTRVDPWSVTKAAFMLALALGVVLVVAVAVLWYVLDVTGFFLTFSRVMGVAIVIASVEIVLVSFLATLFSIMYNLSVGLTGGVEVVLSDEV